MARSKRTSRISPRIRTPAFKRKAGPPKGGTTCGAERNGILIHAHDLVAAIDVEGLASDGGGAVAGEEGARFPEFFGGDVALERGMGFVMFEHVGEAGDAAGGQSVD